MVAHIKKLFVKETVQELPCKDELHVSGIFAGHEVTVLEDVCITQDITGDIYSAKTIIVCKDVTVTGNIYCKKCTLEGKVNGNISAPELIEIGAFGVLNGNIATKSLNVSSAALLNGYVNIIKAKEGKQIYSDIKHSIDRIKELSKQPQEIETEAQPEVELPKAIIEPEPVVKVEMTEVNVPAFEPQPRKERPAVVEVNNERWW